MTEPRQSRAPKKQTTQPRAAFTPPPPLSSGDLKAPVSAQSSRDSAKGLHVVDVRARVPGTGNLATDFQSPKHHYMTGVAVAPEKSTTCENMDMEAAFFADSRELQETGGFYCDVLKRDVHISESSTGDMSNLQKTLRRGCAARLIEGSRSCCFCAATNQDQARENQVGCAECERLKN
jgi:hypothetical protein